MVCRAFSFTFLKTSLDCWPEGRRTFSHSGFLPGRCFALALEDMFDDVEVDEVEIPLAIVQKYKEINITSQHSVASLLSYVDYGQL